MIKKLLPLILLLVLVFQGFSQTEGISYQAVILNPNSETASEDNVLANSDIVIQFTIINENENEEYQEKHSTSTDKYGMINLLIGNGTPISSANFSDIIWDGASKKLKIEIDFSGNSDFTLLSEQNLTYIPQPPNKETAKLISDNTSAILGEETRAKAAEEVNFNGVLGLKGEQKNQNDAIALNTAKISYPGDQDISGIATNSAVIASFKFYYPDKDGDGFGSSWNTVYAPTAPTGYVNNNTDCDDNPSNGATIYPGATEIADDGIDQDCDGTDLKTWYIDADGDGFGDSNTSILSNTKPTGYVSNKTDCNDTPGIGATIYPGATEIPDDNIDQNCDGVI